MLANSKSTFITLALLGAIVALLVVGLLHSQSFAQTEEPDPAIKNGALDISALLLQAVVPLPISQDWFATTIVPPAFFFGQDDTFSPNEFTFNAPVPVMLSVTDDFCKGDRFQIFDNGNPIGMTSVPVNEFPDCSLEVGPDAAFSEPTYSSGSFPLDSGFHHIKIKVIDSPFGGGRGYIEVHEAPVVFEYAAKIICGVQRDPQNMRLAKGFYATAINIHNPNDFEVTLFKKLALTFPPEEQAPGEVIPISEDVLGPDQALEVDCMDIQKELFPDGFPTPYIKGFVVIQSPQSLDVVAVYTTASLNEQGQAGDHSSIHVEQIRERVKEVGVVGLPDLVPVKAIDVDDPIAYCQGDGNLVVTIKNQGTADAGTSTTRVTFSTLNGDVPFDLPTPALTVGSSVDLGPLDFPVGCFIPDCIFTIVADANIAIDESDEGNNSADGLCLG